MNQDNNSFAYLELDTETETYHAQFRQYGPAQGSWMSPDSYSGSYDMNNPQSFNRYSYVLNNPLTFTDRLGLDYGYDRGSNCVGVVGTPDNPCGEAGICGFDGPSGPSGPTTFPLPPLPTTPPDRAPSSVTPWYKNPCIQSAFAKGAASSAIDSVGLLPEGGAVAGAFSLWHGAAGVSNGIKILARVQFRGCNHRHCQRRVRCFGGWCCFACRCPARHRLRINWGWSCKGRADSRPSSFRSLGSGRFVWHISGGGRMPSLKVFTEEDGRCACRGGACLASYWAVFLC